MKVKAVKPLGKLTKTKFQKNIVDHMKSMDVHPSVLRHMRASGWFSDAFDKVKSGIETAVKVIKPLAPYAAKAYSGYKKDGVKGAVSSVIGGKKPRIKSTKAENVARMKVRGKMIAELMKEKQIPLGEASKIVAKELRK